MKNVLLVNFPKISALKEELMNSLANQAYNVSVVHKEAQVLNLLYKNIQQKSIFIMHVPDETKLGQAMNLLDKAKELIKAGQAIPIAMTHLNDPLYTHALIKEECNFHLSLEAKLDEIVQQINMINTDAVFKHVPDKRAVPLKIKNLPNEAREAKETKDTTLIRGQEELDQPKRITFSDLSYDTANIESVLRLGTKEISCQLDHLDNDYLELISADSALLSKQDTENVAEIRVSFKYGAAKLILEFTGQIEEIEPLKSGEVCFSIKIKSTPSNIDDFISQIQERQKDIDQFMTLAKGID